MSIDTIVGNPRSIRTYEEAEDFLRKIKAYESKTGSSAGVLEIQRRLFGPCFRLKTNKEAQGWLSAEVDDRTVEWGEEFYPRSYFEDLQRRLKKGPQPSYV